MNTEASARARIALDDGSVLNVGSDSSLRVTKHDAGAQQTELELTYGKLRSEAAKIAKPRGKFEVKTPAGVAGVVGMHFYTDFANDLMTVIVYEGIVRVCNLAGVCVDVKAGQFTTVRSGDDAPPQQLLDARTSTELGGRVAPGVQQAGHHIGKGTAITLGILAAIPAIVFPIVSSRQGTLTPTPPLCDPKLQRCP